MDKFISSLQTTNRVLSIIATGLLIVRLVKEIKEDANE